jgi:transposase
MVFPAFLLPVGLQVTDCSVSVMEEQIIIEASSPQLNSTCPTCGCSSERKHSKYLRVFGDLPTSGFYVKISLQSRKYFCDNPDCNRKIFTERFAEEILPYHRRFNRCKELLNNLGLELGGNRGSAISRLAKLQVSPSTILRLIKSRIWSCQQ